MWPRVVSRGSRTRASDPSQGFPADKNWALPSSPASFEICFLFHFLWAWELRAGSESSRWLRPGRAWRAALCAGAPGFSLPSPPAWPPSSPWVCFLCPPRPLEEARVQRCIAPGGPPCGFSLQGLCRDLCRRACSSGPEQACGVSRGPAPPGPRWHFAAQTP